MRYTLAEYFMLSTTICIDCFLPIIFTFQFINGLLLIYVVYTNMYILRYIAKMNVGKTLKPVKYQNTVYLNEDNILFYIKYITKFDPHTFYLYIHF